MISRVVLKQLSIYNISKCRPFCTRTKVNFTAWISDNVSMISRRTNLVLFRVFKVIIKADTGVSLLATMQPASRPANRLRPNVLQNFTYYSILRCLF